MHWICLFGPVFKVLSLCRVPIDVQEFISEIGNSWIYLKRNCLTLDGSWIFDLFEGTWKCLRVQWNRLGTSLIKVAWLKIGWNWIISINDDVVAGFEILNFDDFFFDLDKIPAIRFLPFEHFREQKGKVTVVGANFSLKKWWNKLFILGLFSSQKLQYGFSWN
jgi:hypothetical protein